MTTDERMDYIEFRMDLLREKTELATFLYDCRITKEQLRDLYKIMDGLQLKILLGTPINMQEYETAVSQVVNKQSFAVNFATQLKKAHQYEEVYAKLYSGSKSTVFR